MTPGYEGTLSVIVNPGSTTIGGDPTHANIVNIEIQGGGTPPVGDILNTSDPTIFLDGPSVMVYVKVTITETSTEVIYNKIKLKPIAFELFLEFNPVN